MARLPLYYTFGNHMHWVDMEWLWGYHVLPGSVRDMLRFCQETGAKGNVNFEGIGYEKLAAEDPAALAELRDAVQAGTIEPVGCSYGQPYGLFHGGESNVRQRVYGVRTAMRLLGTRPRTFWEEEFDFFPQLPQMLSGVGFKYASLFFQWTWHTPEIPKEEQAVVWWEGQDGSRLLCATRNKLNLHQWPEDMELTFSSLSPSDASGLVLQWLELMPSPDWMCRSEVLLPKMKELLSDDRFEIRMATLGGYLGSLEGDFETRRYSMDDVWHGMSLGKNGDRAPRQSHESERRLLRVESLQAVLGLFGRPYENWDVYPVWEFEEAWRNLLAAQHHDNHECEGLCGHVAVPQYETVTLLTDSGMRGMRHLARRVLQNADDVVVFNPWGWERRVSVWKNERVAVLDLPPMGYATVPENSFAEPAAKWEIEGNVAIFRRGTFEVRVNTDTVRVSYLRSGELVRENLDLPQVQWVSKGETVKTQPEALMVDLSDPQLLFFTVAPESEVGYWLSVPPHLDALDITVSFEPIHFIPDPGLNASARTAWPLPEDAEIVVDHPYSVTTAKPHGEWMRKYPVGDWMTSPQWFETVRDPFTSQSFVDVGGLLLLHNGSQQWFLHDGEIHNAINLVDPWDEDKIELNARVRYRLLLHEGLTHAERWRHSRELFGLPEYADNGESWEKTDKAPSGDMPRTFSALSCSAPNVLPTAFYRETEDYSGRDLDNYAGKGMGYPYVVRLVEFDGIETTATLNVAGTVAKAYKTNLLGEIEEELVADAITLRVKPFEIVTVYLDIVEGRKQTRDLDAKREIWATVHRVEE